MMGVQTNGQIQTDQDRHGRIWMDPGGLDGPRWTHVGLIGIISFAALSNICLRDI